MKKRLTLLILISLLFLIPGRVVFSQPGFSGELRPRSEYRRGFKTLAYPSQDAAFFISQRARLKLGFNAEKFRVFFSFQDIRTWGSTSQLNVSDDFFSMHEAWGELMLTENFSIRFGRQELAYDDHRILGDVDWAQQARSHDLLLVKYEKNGFRGHAGVAYNQDREQLTTNYYSVSRNYKTMQFLWLHKEFENQKGSLLFLNNGRQTADTSVMYSQTIGMYWNFTFSGIKLNAAGYYQMGRDVTKKDLSAGYIFAEVMKTFNPGLTPTLGFEYLSGTGEDNNSTNYSFAPLFGTNHKFNGLMDYFYVGNHRDDVGLVDIYLKLAYKTGKWTPRLALHHFSSAARILDPADPASSLKNYLGMELDLVLGWNIAQNIILVGGYSQMFATASMQAVKGGDHTTINNWAWIMLSIKPDFIKPK